jgi:hypothetical protein
MQGAKSLTQSPDYAKVTSVCSRVGFLAEVSALEDYRLNDADGWSQKLYTYVSNVSVTIRFRR